MEFNLIDRVETCYNFIQQNSPILNYSHIPTTLIALLLGIFVLLKNKKDLSSKLFFWVSIFFALWSGLDWMIWNSFDGRRTMFVWSIINVIENLVSVFTLYFAYVFLKKKDVSFRWKLFFATLFLPYVFLIPTTLNISEFDAVSCEATQGSFINYFYFLESFLFLFLIGFLLRNILHTPKGEVRPILIFSVGVFLFLGSFSGANLAGSLAAVLYPDNPDNWKILQYGLFGMPIFSAFLTYLIVRYNAFNIKLIGVQALVVALALLVGSQLFYVNNSTNFVLTQVSLILIIVVGFILIRSVKEEARRKEELQSMTDSLAKANEDLRQLDTAKSEFISIASHQLRTPLTAIKGFISLILEGAYGTPPPRIEDALNKVYSSNERLIHLVEDLLNLSRMESGRLEYRIEPTHIEDVLKELYAIFQVITKQKGLQFTMNLPETPFPTVSIDFSKLREVLSNIIDNAIKYTKEGSVFIGTELVENNTKIRVSVKDTGIGVPKNEMSNLFQKFSRGKDTTRLHANGTGLGLYVGKQMIEAMGGRIWVESPGEGQGSTFYVEVNVG